MLDSADWQQGFSITQLQALLDGETGEVKTRPEPGNWGYFLDLGPHLGYFSWFASQAQMLRYLVHVEILHAPTSLPERADYDALVANLKAIAQVYVDQGNSEMACQAFNACFPDFKLVWLGPFTSLLNHNSVFSQDLLTAYGKSPELDAEAFLDFLEQYGL